MRSAAPLLLIGLLRTVVLASDGGYSPYSDPLFGLPDEALLVKRQSCSAGYNSCSNLGADTVCCPSGTNCATDEAGHVACCPFNAVCTGTIDGSVIGTSSTTSTGSAVLGGTSSTTSTGPAVLGGTTTSSTSTVSGSITPTTGVAGGGSTVPNTFYPFIYIPTSYANADLCSSAFTSCQQQSTACLTSLAGANGVTVSGLGGGITVQGASGTILSQASSICSSLSAIGCYNLQETQCSIFGSATGVTPTATTTTGFIQVGNNGPRQTACPRMLYAAGAGAVIVGGMI